MEAPRTAQESSRRSAEATVAFGALAGCLTLAIVVVWVAARTGDVVPAALRGGAKPILVTGFRAFNGEENPSSVCARRLNGTRAPSGRLIYSTLLSVDGRGAGVAAARLDAYAAVVHLGLEDATTDLRVEVAAHNIRGGDATGTCATRPVVADGPCALATTAPLGRVALRGDEHWSTSAGTFFCNEAYYRTLAAARGRRGARGAFVPVAFVHLPNETTRAVDSYLPRLADVVHALAGADRALR